MSRFTLGTIFLLLAACWVGIGYAMLNVLPYDAWLGRSAPKTDKELDEEIDRRGGARFLLSVDMNEALADWYEGLRDQIRLALKRRVEGAIGFADLQLSGNEVRLRIRKAEQYDEALKRIKDVIASAGGPSAFSIKEEAERNIVLIPTGDEVRSQIITVISATAEILRQRIEELGVHGATILRRDNNTILVQVPGEHDADHLRSILTKKGSLTFQLLDPNFPDGPLDGKTIPPTSEVVASDNATVRRKYVLKKRVLLSGHDLNDVQTSIDPTTAQPLLTFRFNRKAAKRFSQITKSNVGRSFAIVVDNAKHDRKVVTAPVIREPIFGGSGQISGNFTVKEVADLALLLRVGALPAALAIDQERIVTR